MSTTKKQHPDLTLPLKKEEPHIGNINAEFQLVMYGDYEDPKCRKAFVEMEQIIETYADKIVFVWRHFPLNKIFQKSQKAAELAVALHEQGKFWEVHKLLIAENNKLNLTDLIGYAKEVEAYNKNVYSALTNNKHSWDVRDSMRGGVESGIKKLPALFINGKLMDADFTYKNIEAALKS